MINLKNDDLLINKEVNENLKNILKKKAFSNGYIFYGPEGIGKKQTALRFIKEILKQQSLTKNIDDIISNNNHPDLFLIEPNNLNKVKISKNSGNKFSENNNLEIIKIDKI